MQHFSLLFTSVTSPFVIVLLQRQSSTFTFIILLATQRKNQRHIIRKMLNIIRLLLLDTFYSIKYFSLKVFHHLRHVEASVQQELITKNKHEEFRVCSQQRSVTFCFLSSCLYLTCDATQKAPAVCPFKI